MRRLRLFLSIFLLGLSLFSAWTAVSAQLSQPVHILYFYSKDCVHCKAVREQVLAPMQAQYGQSLVLHEFEIGQAQNYEGLVRVEMHFNVPGEKRGIPTLVIGDKILIGEDEIRQQLPALVQNGLASGIPWPNIPEIAALQTAPTSAPLEVIPAGPAQPGAAAPTPKPTAGVGCSVDNPSSCSTGKTVWMAYFYTSGCEVCSIAKNDIEYLRQKHPSVIVEEFNIGDHAGLGQWMAAHAGRKSITTPAVFVGGDALIGGGEMTPQALENLVKKYEFNGSERTWDEYDPAASGLVARYQSMGVLAFVTTGLLDGLNPLALAALLLFLFLTAAAGRFEQPVLASCLALIAGLFAAYFGLGLALLKGFILAAPLVNALGRWVYAAFLAILAVLAVICFRAYVRAWQGKQDVSRVLRLSQWTGEGSGWWLAVAAALMVGLLAALLELAGTGASYLQTIALIGGLPTLRGLSLQYLLLYNAAFILPLLIVFGLIYYFAAPRNAGEEIESEEVEE